MLSMTETQCKVQFRPSKELSQVIEGFRQVCKMTKPPPEHPVIRFKRRYGTIIDNGNGVLVSRDAMYGDLMEFIRKCESSVIADPNNDVLSRVCYRPYGIDGGYDFFSSGQRCAYNSLDNTNLYLNTNCIVLKRY